MRIVIENHDANELGSLFRVTVDDRPVAENLTAAQAHLSIGDIFERSLGPKRRPDATPTSRAQLQQEDI